MKLAFIREPGAGTPIWDGATYPTPGWTLVMDVPSQPETVFASTGNETQWTPNGTFHPIPAPARPAYMGTVHATSPNAWQSGWATNWDHIGIRPELVGSIIGGFFPEQQGKAELGASMLYQQGPSLGQVAPKL